MTVIYRRNVARNVSFALLDSSGALVTTSPTVTAKRKLDGGAWEDVDGSVTEDSAGTGWHTFNGADDDWDADFAEFRFTAAGAVPVLIRATAAEVIGEATLETDQATHAPTGSLSAVLASRLATEDFTGDAGDDFLENLLGLEIEPGDTAITLLGALRIVLAACAGVSAGAVPGASCTVTFASAADPETERISAECDGSGNRSEVTLTPS